MAHFRGSTQGNRGLASRVGTKSSGIDSHTNGWNAGVRVAAIYDKEAKRDDFEVYATHGSSGNTEEVLIAIVSHDSDGWKLTRTNA